MWSLRYRKRHSKKELTFFQFLSRLFQLAYKIMQANSSRVEFITTISTFRKRKFLHRLVTSSLKYKITHFHVVVEKERQKMYKKRDVVLPIQPIAFLTFLFSSPSWQCVYCPCRAFLDSLFLVSDTWQGGVVRRLNNTIPPPPPPRLICIKRATLPKETTAESVLVTQRGRMEDSEL